MKIIYLIFFLITISCQDISAGMNKYSFNQLEYYIPKTLYEVHMDARYNIYAKFAMFLKSSKSINPVGYPMPIGIPDPRFGILDTMASYHGGFANYYTYYIHPDDPNSTDTANTYGTVGVPRKTLPSASSLVPGDVIEIHGNYGSGSTYTFSIDGTAEEPIFIRGDAESRPTIRGRFYINCKYLYFENIIIDQTQTMLNAIMIYPQNGSHPIDHIVIRNCEICHYSQADEGGNSSMVYVGDNSTGQYPSNIVFYQNYVHDNGNSTGGRDCHAFLIGKSSYVWILNNEMYNNAADSVQVTTGSDPENSIETPTNHIFIGRNIMHGEHENALDVKRGIDIVFSENDCYDFDDTHGTWGGCPIELHMGGYSPITPARILIINNVIHNCTDGAISMEDDLHDIYIVGNLIYDIGVNNNSEWSRAIIIWNIGEVYIYNNTFHNCNSIFGIDRYVDDISNVTDIRNNIFSEICGDVYPQIIYNQNGGTTYSSTQFIFDNNLMYNSDGQYLFWWNYQAIISWVAFQLASGKGNNCYVDNPLFVTAENNFHLQSGSLARNAGDDISSSIYADFDDNYDRDIDDIATTNHDIGCYAYVRG